MGFLRKLFGSKQPTTLPGKSELPASAEAVSAMPAVNVDALKSVIRKRAATIGIPQETVEANIKNLSPKQLGLLAETADNFFMIYLWSPFGTQAKADAAIRIGLRS